MKMILILLCLMSTLDGLMSVPDHLKEIVVGEGRFAAHLGTIIAFGEKQNMLRNFLFSPHSIYRNLLTVYVASHGKTEELIEDLLFFDPYNVPNKKNVEDFLLWSPPHNRKYELTSVDRIYHTADLETKKDFETKFKDKIAVYSISDQINDWVSQQTKGKITEIVKKGEIPGPQTAVFVNAAYFKGYWTVPFYDIEEIVPFKLFNGTKVDTLMMTTKGKFKLGKLPRTLILTLPYEGDDIAMMIQINDVKDNSSSEWVPGLGELSLKEYLELSNQKECETEVKIPKFHSTHQYDLKKILPKIGGKELFSQPLDLSNAFETGPLLKSTEFIHKATLSVSETGTEASAATQHTATNSWAECQFYAVQPFQYIIYDRKTYVIHYMGFVTDPTQ